MNEEMYLFLVSESEQSIPIEFPLSYLLDLNFNFGDKEDVIKNLNEFIKEIEKYRDNL
ncbi:MAG: hypothetical protein IJ213_00865 [Bacteroidales bacterium]|nr:hypothetical protein [Bacteroidales bacterium]